MRSGANTEYWVWDKAAVSGPFDQGLLVALVRARIFGDDATVARHPDGPWQPAVSFLPPLMPGEDGLPVEDLGAKAATQERRWLIFGLLCVLIELGYFIVMMTANGSNSRLSDGDPKVDKIDRSKDHISAPDQSRIDPLNPPTDLSPYEMTNLLKSYDSVTIQLGPRPHSISVQFLPVEIPSMVIGGTAKPLIFEVNGAYISTLADLWQTADAERRNYVSLCEDTKEKYLELCQGKTYEMIADKLGYKSKRAGSSLQKKQAFKETATARQEAYRKLVDAAAAYNSQLRKLESANKL